MIYDTTKFKLWKLPNPLLLHWILNPGIAFNEVVLGQRVPKLTLIDKTSNAPLLERQYVGSILILACSQKRQNC